MAVRKNVANLTPAEKTQYVNGCKLLKADGRYDQYVQLHADSTSVTAPNGSNAAHMGPAFLPWHREFILRFERDLQQVLNDPNFGLPYWDWAADAASPNPTSAPVWASDFMAGNGSPVSSGLFTPAQWQTTPPGGLNRDLGADADAPTLPTQADVNAALTITTYDSDPWNMDSGVAGVPGTGPSFRNQLEGWINGPQLHNRVHVWVGGHMADVPVAPNDPVFFLHHCNVDRIWALWQLCSPNPAYLPTTGGPTGHNLNDPMFPWLSGPGPGTTPPGLRDGRRTPTDLLNITQLGYSYESPQRQTITLRRTAGNRFVSDKVIQVVSSCNPQAETASTLFVPGAVGGVIRAQMGTQTDQVDVVP